MNKAQKQISRLTVAAVITTPLLSFMAQAQIRYVDDDAPLLGDGLTWNTAYRYLQDALAEAAGDPGITEIRVGQGTHKPDQDESGNVTRGDRQATFQLIDGVSLMGGFAGMGAPDPNECNILLCETILSGDLNGDDGPDCSNVDDNSLHVLFAISPDPTTVLDGFTITAGNANGEGIHNFGGGMRMDGGGLTISQCSFFKNCAVAHGGGAYIDAADLSVVSCTFEQNSALRGGGLAADGEVNLVDCTFFRNTVTRDGGGAYLGGTVISVTHCQFVENEAGDNAAGSAVGGGLRVFGTEVSVIDCDFVRNQVVDPPFGGGGGAVIGGTDQTTIIACRFEENAASEQGGGLATGGTGSVSNCIFAGNTSAEHGGGLSIGHAKDIPIVGCTFTGNSAGDGHGGAIYSPNVTGSIELVVQDCIFMDNSAHASGGAIFAEDKAVTLMRCLFERNEALLVHGGACRFESLTGTGLTATACTFVGNSAAASGGGISHFGNGQVTNCAFLSNTAKDGGGMAAGRGAIVANCTFSGNTGGGMFGGGSISNCVLWSNSPDQIFGSPVVSFSNVQGGFAGPNNIDADPVFVDADGPDDDPLTLEDNNYRLDAGSPCIDAADNTAVPGDIATDLDGNPRFVNDPATADTGNGDCAVDMGAYEFQGGTVVCCPGDINGDGGVNVLDLIELLLAFGTSCP